MKQLTEHQIKNFKILAQKETSVESNVDDWNPSEISGGNFDDCYEVGYIDSEIENARFILDLVGIEY